MDEKQLVLSAKNGDKEAFCALYSLYKTRLYRYAFYRLGNPEDAEDAVSDCVIAAFEHIKTLKKAEAFPAWIFAILYRSCNAVIKVQAARRTMADVQEMAQSLTTDMEQTVTKTELLEALGTLHDEEKQIVLLSVVSGLNSKEIARITDLTAGGVRSKLSRSLAKMKSFLER